MPRDRVKTHDALSVDYFIAAGRLGTQETFEGNAGCTRLKARKEDTRRTLRQFVLILLREQVFDAGARKLSPSPLGAARSIIARRAIGEQSLVEARLRVSSVFFSSVLGCIPNFPRDCSRSTMVVRVDRFIGRSLHIRSALNRIKRRAYTLPRNVSLINSGHEACNKSRTVPYVYRFVTGRGSPRSGFRL